MTGASKSHDERVAELIAAFEREFGRKPEGIAEAPGRINLIGEHVDYNEGLVLPFAIDRRALCAWASRADDRTSFQSSDVSGNVACWPGELPPRHQAWFDYGVAVVSELVGRGEEPWGVDLLTAGAVPQGAGLSSSAALEVAIAGAFRDAFSLPISDVDLALLCQRAENEYVGVRCGIMDQFASTLSKRDHALLIDCRSLECEHIPLRLDDAGLTAVVTHSGVKRELAASAFNERRRECEQAVEQLRERIARPDLPSLRDVTPDDMARLTIDTVPLRRARQVVSEISRVQEAVAALRRDDFAVLGELMRQSHTSLRDDYEVSSPELDLLTDLANAQSYVVGSRLTGAGFGGCTISLVRSDALHAFERDVVGPYCARTGLDAEGWPTRPSDGLRTWRL